MLRMIAFFVVVPAPVLAACEFVPTLTVGQVVGLITATVTIWSIATLARLALGLMTT